MSEGRSYVVRIYRRDVRTLAGVVEDVQGGRSAPFRSFDELAALLSAQRRFPRRASRAAGDGAPPTTEEPR